MEIVHSFSVSAPTAAAASPSSWRRSVERGRRRSGMLRRRSSGTSLFAWRGGLRCAVSRWGKPRFKRRLGFPGSDSMFAHCGAGPDDVRGWTMASSKFARTWNRPSPRDALIPGSPRESGEFVLFHPRRRRLVTFELARGLRRRRAPRVAEALAVQSLPAVSRLIPGSVI